jgi:hypothetical protein
MVGRGRTGRHAFYLLLSGAEVATHRAIQKS